MLYGRQPKISRCVYNFTLYFAKVRLKPEYLLTRGRDEEAIYDVSATSRGTGVGGAARPRQQSPLAYVKTFATLLWK